MKIPSRLSLIAALLAFSLPAAAVDFDASIDAAAVLGEARAAVVAADARAARTIRYDRDCATFHFGPNDGLVSRAVELRSREWVEECYQTGDPRHGGGRQCHERPGHTYYERAQVTLTERRPLLPWESDTFQVCLEGPWVQARQFDSAYEYRRANSNRDGNVVAAPVQKTPMLPDPTGVTATLAPDAVVTFADKWASYYAGETVMLKLTLKRHYPNWFDTVLLEKEVSLPVAAAYVLDLKADAAQMSEELRAGKPYYVAYQVMRVGAVSKPEYTKSIESNKAVYAPAAALASN